MVRESRVYNSKVKFETPNDRTLPESYEGLITPIVQVINGVETEYPLPMYVKKEITEINGVMVRYELRWGDTTMGVTPRLMLEYERQRTNQHRITLTGAKDITDQIADEVFDICEVFFSQN